jgi:hypothetical protein
MKPTIQPTLIALLLATSSLAFADDKSQTSPPKLDPKMAEMMKKMEAAGTPGAAHEVLKSLAGEWKAEVTNWMAPGAPATVTQGKAKNTWILGGRFIQGEFEGEFAGKPFHGLSLMGYDNTKQRYESVWIDDAGTALVTAEGTASDAGRVITLEGKYDCPMTGQKDRPMKQVYRIVSRDQHVFEMHDPTKGKDSKTMEITYTRK